MRLRPVIGLATQTVEATGERPACWIMGQRYVRSLVAAGAVPWLVPLLSGDEAMLHEIYDRLDGVFLTGGVDMDPANYGEERHASCDRSDLARDWTEVTLVRWAVRDRKPLLGVCRGIQAINVACGGSLYQDITDQHPGAIKHDYFSDTGAFRRDYLAHPVRVAADSHLRRILETDQMQVNSMHHQGIKRLAPGLTASAFAPDGLIEAIEKSEGSYLVGVQWHPEELTEAHPPMYRLFADFVAAAGSSRSR